MTDRDAPQLSTDRDGWPVDNSAEVAAVAKSLGIKTNNNAPAAAAADPATAPAVEETGTDDDDVDVEARASSSSSSSSNSVDPKILRGFCYTAPLPWSTFLRLRRSWGQIKLTEAQEENVYKALEKIPQGIGKIYDSLPFVSAFIDKHCPELRVTSLSVPRPGSTLLLLSVITGNVALCTKCLQLGANPNSCKFLTDTDVGENELRHGYSPMFLACICEQIEIMELLRQHGGSIHTMDRWGRTPLHAAAAMGSSEVLQWLLREGAPRKVVDCDLLVPGEMCVGKVLDALAEPSVLLRTPTELRRRCSCSSGKLFLNCGCVDDMYSRWYLDRLKSQWSTTFASARMLAGSAGKLPASTGIAAADLATLAVETSPQQQGALQGTK
jgi:hypothetical protein